MENDRHDRLPKQMVNYQEWRLSVKKRCELCAAFQAMQTPKDWNWDGICFQVDGAVKRTAICDLFTKIK